ncbi:MAG: 2-C-methyl-D-erythritol 4-phosphate cytidylyltransferase [Nitrospirota bacterium]|jgi:2-C-methyl-D-erythritol 4-phosphate cytidylyltransferase
MSGRVVAVVPAAGAGVRFGASKTFVRLLGRPVLAWTLAALAASEEVSEIIPVLKEEDLEACLALVEEHGIPKVRRVAPGGVERQDSVLSGLRLVEDEDSVVLIHDGVRPLVDAALVANVLKGLEGFDGSVCAVAPKETIKELGQDGTARSTPPRELLVAVQTPQAFGFGTLMEAYRKAGAEGFRSTDDSALVERAGGRVNVVEGSYRNIKITTPEDMLVAELFLKNPAGGCDACC